MIKYFIMQFVEPSFVVYAYRGTETNNVLEMDVPSDQLAVKVVNITPGINQTALDQLLYYEAIPLLKANPEKTLLIRVEDNRIVIWMV